MTKSQATSILGERAGRIREGASPEYTENFYGPVIAETAHLFPYVLRYNKAHTVMLFEQGIIPREDAVAVIDATSALAREGVENVTLNPGLLGIYPNIEALTIQKAGLKAGGLLYTGRSRNDAQRVPDRMANRDQVLDCLDALADIVAATLHLSEKHITTLIPNTATLQHAQPMTFGFYLLWFVEALEDGFDRISEAWTRLNRSSAEIGAGMMTSFPVNRYRVAELLGFEGLIENGIYAHRSMDRELEVMSCLSQTMLNVYRLFEDFMFWCSTDVGYLELADAYSSRSFMMPQKRNPIGLLYPQMVAMQVHHDYNLLFNFSQRTTSDVILHGTQLMPTRQAAMKVIPPALRATAEIIATARPKPDRMKSRLDDGFAQATDLSDMLVQKYGLSYRQSYLAVGQLIRNAEEAGLSSSSLTNAMLDEAIDQALGEKVNVSASDFQAAMDFMTAISAKKIVGGVAPEMVQQSIKAAYEKLEQRRGWISVKRKHIENSIEALDRACAAIMADEGR